MNRAEFLMHGGLLCAGARSHNQQGSETDVKELIVKPAVRPSAQRAVTTATPVGKAPSARRNSRSSVTEVSAAGGGPVDLSTQRSPAARVAPQFREPCFRIQFQVVVSFFRRQRCAVHQRHHNIAAEMLASAGKRISQG